MSTLKVVREDEIDTMQEKGGQPSQNLIDFILERNRLQSEAFCNPEAALWRKLHSKRHPTEIAALKCMDGRLNISVMTNTPPGIITPWRNIGGKFDLGWPSFGDQLHQWVENVIRRGRTCFILNTYHFSRGDTHRGCAGFGYDTDASKKAMWKRKEQIERAFGAGHRVVYPVQVGIETDEDVLIFHGVKDQKLDLADEVDTSEKELLERLGSLYPDMSDPMLNDLLPLLVGNQEHIKEIRSSGRKIEELDHGEQILGIGRGFDWLHLPNRALIIGPFDTDWPAAVTVAAKILLSNIQEGRIPEEQGVVLLASAAFAARTGSEHPIAIERARHMAEKSMTVIKEGVPELRGHLHVLTGVVDVNTRRFERTPYTLS